MKRAFVFTSRNIKELLRDPLSYIFCIGFPIVMLVMMSLINTAIPPEAGMDLFNIGKLAPGIAVFALSFVMLFATLQLSKDRTGAFLNRLFSSPMTASDFITGYTLPLLAISLAQFAVTYLCSFIIALVSGESLNILNILLSCATLLPCALLFIGIGMIFGTFFGEKAAPPCSSIIISLCGVIGGIWFDTGTLPDGNILAVLCDILPFSHATAAARAAVAGNYGDIWIDLLITAGWAVAAYILAIIAFSVKMKSENK